MTDAPDRHDGTTVLHVYRCSVCRGHYLVGARLVACHLNHPSGACCHSGERPLTATTLNRLLHLVGGQQADRERMSAVLREP